MFVTGKLKGVVVNTSETLLVPATAVMWTGERSLVYVKTKPSEAVFEMREVTIGKRRGDNFEITEGLKNGDEIVTHGTFTVDAAAQLQGKKSMMHNGNDENAVLMPVAAMKITFPKSFHMPFKEALNAYLEMKDAFVASDAGRVSTLAKVASKSFKSVNIKDFGKMEQTHVAKSIEMLDVIAESDDLENQREHFVILNENMVVIAMNVEIVKPAIYVQKCPMANNNKGAFWLSTEKDIRNPYYGEQMLTCGSVIDSIE